jgi:hypothetical protein
MPARTVIAWSAWLLSLVPLAPVIVPVIVPAASGALLRSEISTIAATTCWPSPLQVKETTRDVTFLHNELFFAAAQKKYVYIYDKRGLEVHCLRNHVAPEVLEFLPHHFLLSSIGEQGACKAVVSAAGSC